MKQIIAMTLALGLSAYGVAQAQTARPAANPNAPENSAVKDPHGVKPGGLAAGRNSFTQGQAREHIEKAGYTKVTGLKKDKNGLWQARAVKDGQPVRVAMDFKGDVRSQ